MARGIYKFCYDGGRHGRIYGLFTEEAENVAEIQGKSIYVGSLGKHWSVQAEIGEDSTLKLVSDDPAHVELFEKLGLSVGVNPYDNYDPDEEEQDE